MAILYRYHRPDIIGRRDAADFCHNTRAASGAYSAVCREARSPAPQINDYYLVDFFEEKEYNTAGQAGRSAVLCLFS